MSISKSFISVSVRVLKCSSCSHQFTQKSTENGSFEKITECPKCCSTKIGTLRVFQSEK